MKSCKIWKYSIIAVIAYVLVSLHPSAAEEKDPHANLPSVIDSHTCLGCHDGAIAPHKGGHPIGMNYAASSLKRWGGLRPLATLPASIRLEEGRVGCVSCHDTSSSLPAKLIRSNAGSALCFACHNL